MIIPTLHFYGLHQLFKIDNNARLYWEPAKRAVSSMRVAEQQTADIDKTIQGEKELLPGDDDTDAGGFEDEMGQEENIEDEYGKEAPQLSISKKL